MASTLRMVLSVFETADRPLTLHEMARRLDVTPGTLEGMIDYWVRKGRLRDTAADAAVCTTCSGATSCPFASQQPRRYVLVTDIVPAEGLDAAPPGCTCCH